MLKLKKGNKLMKIISTESLLLDKIFNDLENEHIAVIKKTQKIKGSMDTCTTIAIIVASLKGVDSIINLLKFWQEQRNYYIQITLKDGRVKKLNGLSKEKKEQEYQAIKDNNNIEIIEIGQK